MSRTTNSQGVEGVRRDYRGQATPLGLPRHLLGQHDAQHVEVRHVCPECGLTTRPFCAVCLGVGSITADRLDRYADSTMRAP